MKAIEQSAFKWCYLFIPYLAIFPRSFKLSTIGSERVKQGQYSVTALSTAAQSPYNASPLSLETSTLNALIQTDSINSVGLFQDLELNYGMLLVL